jgi:hypothetical protein
MITKGSLLALEREEPPVLTGTNEWHDSNAGNSLVDTQDAQYTPASVSAPSLASAMVLHDDHALHHARGTSSDQDSDVSET